MRKPPERVLLFRSGRHLRTALSALAAAAPGSIVTVVSSTGGLSALNEAGVPPAQRIIYDRTPVFRPLGFLCSLAGWRALSGGFDRVCVLWTEADGAGHGNVDRTALLVSPSGFWSITADGSMTHHSTWPLVRRESTRALRSVAIAGLLGLFLFLPARVLRPFRVS